MESTGKEQAIDTMQLAAAEAWERRMVESGFYRQYFFEAFSQQIQLLFQHAVSILEIGSGPGHLAQHLLNSIQIRSSVIRYSIFQRQCIKLQQSIWKNIDQ